MAVEYMGDATNDKSVDNEKVHVGFITTTSLTHADVDAMDPEQHLQADVAPCTYSCCDIIPVRLGTTEETEAIVRKQFKSVGCPHWTDRMAASELSPADGGVFCMCCCALDAGPDNVGLSVRTVSLLARHYMISVVFVFCFMHQYQLIVKALLTYTDKWEAEWGTDADMAGTPFVSGVATIANVWRSPGVPTKLYNACCLLYTDMVANDVCRITPSKAVKTRWGALQKVLKIIVRGAGVAISEQY